MLETSFTVELALVCAAVTIGSIVAALSKRLWLGWFIGIAMIVILFEAALACV